MMKSCRMCKAELKGRRDKMFCSLNCKNEYHVRLRHATSLATRQIDTILHRNRSILLEIMGKNKTQKKIDIATLHKKKFNFNHVTGFSINSKNKTYHHVYDFSWMKFSDNSVLIVRRHH